jgi:hypothetical protein
MLLCKAVQGAALCAGMLDLRLSAASVSQSEEHVSHSQHLLSTRLLVVGECAFCAFCAFLRFLRFSQWWASALFALALRFLRHLRFSQCAQSWFPTKISV